jgi:hypothetical protein
MLRSRRLPVLALAPLFVARNGYAVDPFEIQVYDGTANAPGVPALEIHANHVFSGLTTSEPPELPLNHQTHLTLEPSLGLAPFWEVGGYFQTALRADGTFDYAGVKLRSKFVTPPDWSPHLRLGVNLELSILPETYDRDRWGAEVRPIVAWENERWLLAANPILGFAWAGPGAHDGLTFEPAAMAKIKIENTVAIGLEYYASVGPIFEPAALDDELHYIYEVVDVLGLPHLELNVGVGEGFAGARNALVGKLIVGYAWEADAPPCTPTAGGVRPSGRNHFGPGLWRLALREP